MIHKDTKDLKNKNVLKYIAEGEQRGFDRRPTCASRKRWYDLGIWKKPDFVWSDAYNDRYGIYDTKKTWADKRFFYIYLRKKALFVYIHAFLNSSIIPLAIEIDGITNLGEGAIYTNVYQLKKLGIPLFKKIKRERLVKVLNSLKKRKILSIFSEIGALHPDEVSLDKVKPDRRELDKIIMGEILGLTDEEQLEVYRAVVDLVKSRLDRAKSVDNNKVMEGINVDSFKNVVIEQIDRETSK